MNIRIWYNGIPIFHLIVSLIFILMLPLYIQLDHQCIYNLRNSQSGIPSSTWVLCLPVFYWYHVVLSIPTLSHSVHCCLVIESHMSIPPPSTWRNDEYICYGHIFDKKIVYLNGCACFTHQVISMKFSSLLNLKFMLLVITLIKFLHTCIPSYWQYIIL